MSGRRGVRSAVTVARLRRWLLAGLVLLLLVVGGAIGLARWKTHKFLHDLPGRLGADIKTQANGWTWSQSVKGRTLFTVHAAKAVQRQNGKTTLHDVYLNLYGPVGSNRTDTMRGAEFEYDQPNGVVRAAGQVFMDLASPVTEPSGSGSKPAAKRIQATTSGLIFLQKLGVAATDEPIDLVYGDLRARATGADYETDTGILRLRSHVQMDGTQDGKPVHLTARSAELDRNTRLTTLHGAEVNAGGTRAAGDTVVLDAGPSGGIDVVRADGHAWIESEDGVKASAPKLVAKLSAQSKPVLVAMSGGVQLSAQDSTGTANEAVLHFDSAGQPMTGAFTGSVRIHQTSPTSQDDLAADRVMVDLLPDGAKHTVLRDATATGSAVLRSVSTATPMRSTVIHGDSLHTVFGQSGRRQFVASLTGTGATRLDDDDGKGNIRSSTGDALDVTMLPPAPRRTTPLIASAVQSGHVTVSAKASGSKGKLPAETHATASRAEFVQQGDRLTLTGSPVVTGSGMQVAAQRVDLLQGTGDAEATGSVTGVYVPADKPNAEPVHISADHAMVNNNGDSARFFGAGKPARMWTATAQVEAPVIELERSSGRMMAHAPASSSAMRDVHLLLPVATGKGKGGPAKVTGSSLLYVPAESGKQAHADITGGIRMDSSGTVLTAKQAIATLSNDPKAAGVMSGSVQQVVATGDVHLLQPGREGQGDRLVYTAADERYVLSGSPKVTDSQRGTLIGNTLVLHGTDGSVEVTGSGGQRVQTETDAASPRR